jgi:hypothetical protein
MSGWAWLVVLVALALIGTLVAYVLVRVFGAER